ncbi:MAG: polysaccharide biosynthesis protein [Candidatus Gastranaerophilales bacterium]|nr:polysaccharide biosynthesis protein [Candidatus Gastranaerophilales bacterium]
MFRNKTLLITGGTGSFGNQVLKFFLQNSQVKEIRIFSRDEEKQNKMRSELNDDRIKYYIGDVRDYTSIHNALYDVDYVFHAAALKQVPSCEFYPMEAVKTNILGTDNVLNASVEHNVKKVIVLSTDKAVYPINAMGMTKAMAEKLMVAKSMTVDSKKTILCAVRYGNVMTSRGSVIPLFIKQCKEGKPITITDPDMTRFLMSLEESVELVLYAYNNARAGDIFVQKAPASTIYDLACAVRQIFNPKNEIQVIGTRHGEKAHETLVNREEKQRAQDLGMFYRICADTRNLNYNKYFTEGDLTITKQDEYNSFNTTRLNVDEIIEKLLKLDYIQQELKTAIK